MSGLLHEAFGWLWIGVGMSTGVLLGRGFTRDTWLGGYGSWPRRLLRLGHVAMIALGLLNVLFAFSVGRVALPDRWLSAAGWSLIAGAVLMPACCALAAFRRSATPWFAVPVLCLLFGVTCVWVGLARAALLTLDASSP